MEADEKAINEIATKLKSLGISVFDIRADNQSFKPVSGCAAFLHAPCPQDKAKGILFDLGIFGKECPSQEAISKVLNPTGAP